VENSGGLPSPPPPHLHLLRTLTRKGSPPPLPTIAHLCSSSGNAFVPFFLFSCTLPFIFDAVGLLPRHILKQDDPPWITVHTSKTQQHEHISIKKAKIDTIKWKQARADSSRGGQPCPSRELGRSQIRSVSLP
jgi:hypothetical protein